MDKALTAIATMTWARDEAEEKLLRGALNLLAETGLPVFVTDGGSNPGFLEFLNSFPHFTVMKAEAKGVWAQVKNSLQKAFESGATFILYTEPDKFHFFQHYLPAFLGNNLLYESSGIVIASRSAAAFKTFPPFQQMTETTINKCTSEIVGHKEDYTYGPFLLNSKLVPYLDLIKEDIAWGWRPFVFGLAPRLGYTLRAVTGEYFCPPEQREDNSSERIYRMKQLEQNIRGIILSASVQPDGII